MGALTRQAGIAGTLIAVWPHGDGKLSNIFTYNLRQRPKFHQGVWFLFIVFLSTAPSASL